MTFGRPVRLMASPPAVRTVVVSGTAVPPVRQCTQIDDRSDPVVEITVRDDLVNSTVVVAGISDDSHLVVVHPEQIGNQVGQRPDEDIQILV